MAPVQLVQNVHRFASFALDQVMLNSSAKRIYSTKAKNIVNTRFRCYLPLTAQRTWKQDGLLRDPTVSKVTHYPHIKKLPWPMYRMSTVVLPLVEIMQHCTSVWMHDRKAKYTKNSSVSVLFKALYTLDLKLRGDAKWSNAVQIRALCTGNKVFLTH